MLSTTTRSWTFTLAAATLAVALAATGLVMMTFTPAAAPALATGLLAGSLLGTTAAFATLAARVRRLEMENMGLIEEISQEFDRVKDRLEIFQEALAEPHTLDVAEEQEIPLRRVVVK